MGERIAVRILGVASTTRGFAFAVTEGPRRLVHWGMRRVPAKTTEVIKALDIVLQKARPIFVAFELKDSQKKRHRGQMFGKAVTTACDAQGILLLAIGSGQTKALSTITRPSKWDVAEAVAKLIPETSEKLPPRRKPWQSEGDRIGSFMALAAAISAWESFRKPH